MSNIYLLQRNVTLTEKVIARMKSEVAGEVSHTRSEKKMKKMEAEGWLLLASISGFNMSIDIKE